MLWVFLALAGCELVGAYLLLSLWSPKLAWVLSGLTLITLLWLVRWVVSWQSHPHELLADRLRLNMGSLRRVDVPLALIERVSAEVPAAELQANGTRNLVPFAHRTASSTCVSR